MHAFIAKCPSFPKPRGDHQRPHIPYGKRLKPRGYQNLMTPRKPDPWLGETHSTNSLSKLSIHDFPPLIFAD